MVGEHRGTPWGSSVSYQAPASDRGEPPCSGGWRGPPYRTRRRLATEENHRAPGVGEVVIGRIDRDLLTGLQKVLPRGQAGVDDPGPPTARLERGQLHPLQLPVGVQDEEEPSSPGVGRQHPGVE